MKKYIALLLIIILRVCVYFFQFNKEILVAQYLAEDDQWHYMITITQDNKGQYHTDCELDYTGATVYKNAELEAEIVYFHSANSGSKDTLSNWNSEENYQLRSFAHHAIHPAFTVLDFLTPNYCIISVDEKKTILKFQIVK